MIQLRIFVVLLACALLIFSKRVPLIILGVDGYAFQTYQELGHHLDDVLFALPLQPVFPTASFPNFYSISTGLYPTQHGIIGNVFLNKHNNATFFFNNQQHEQFDWFRGEPIWITAKKSGLRVYTDMWIGAAADHGGVRPDYVNLFDKTKTFQEKTEDLVSNLDNEGERCDLYMVYHHEPDNTLHITEMENKTAVKDIHNTVEEQISYLISSLGAPGMWYTRDEDGIESTVQDLNIFLSTNKIRGVAAVDVTDLPTRYKFCGLERRGLPEIVLMVDKGVMIRNKFPSFFKSGHGYDNTLSEMRGLLRVLGPGFKNRETLRHVTSDHVTSEHVIMNTELYNLFCSLLGIKPAANTGTLNKFDFLLTNPPDRRGWEMSYTQIPEPCT
ncbi:hypothetical protein ACHWQZ_G010165 [Mnemiopsis leidyi]